MRIAIINITGGGMSGGYRKYLCNVIPKMADHHEVQAVLCASPGSLNVKDWFEPLYNVQFLNCRPFRFIPYKPNRKLKDYLETFSPDVIFVPIERPFRFKAVPIVNMLQNMEPLVFDNKDNHVSEILRNWVRSKLAKEAVEKANRVIAVSEFVKGFLVKQWQIPIEKIGVVYHGLDSLEKCDCVKTVKIPIGWKGKYLFTAGSIRPARGLEDVLLAMKHLTSKNVEMGGLVIAGQPEPKMIGYQRKLKTWVEKQGLSDMVCWAGHLNESEMAWCYQNCSVFLMTSRVESFGQIGIEAMMHGCICVAADNPCLPEIFTDAASYYPPRNAKALAEAIETVLSWDSQQRRIMSDRAKIRATQFSWDACAQKTVEELKLAAEGFARRSKEKQ